MTQIRSQIILKFEKYDTRILSGGYQYFKIQIITKFDEPDTVYPHDKITRLQ